MNTAGDKLSLSEFAAWADSVAQSLASGNMGDALSRCEELAVAQVQENFAGQHGPDGVPWPPLADGSGRPPLEGLEQCIQSTVDADGVSVWIESDHAAFHQNGTRTIPARPMVGFTDEQADQFAGVFGDWLIDQLR